MAYPTTIETPTNPIEGTLAANDHSGMHTEENAILVAVQNKIGVTDSAVATSIDYQLNNTASIDPGHHHTSGSLDDLVAADITDFTEAAQDAAGALAGNTTSANMEYNDSDPSLKVTVNANTTVQKVITAAEGSDVGTGRQKLNFIQGTGIGITVADDTPNDRTNITFAATGGTKFFITPTQSTLSGNTTQTIFTTTLAGGSLGTTKGIMFEALVTDIDFAGFNDMVFTLTYGSTAIATVIIPLDGTKSNHMGEIRGYLASNADVNAQTGGLLIHAGLGNVGSADTVMYGAAYGTAAVNSASDQTFKLQVNPGTSGSITFGPIFATYVS